MKNHIIIKGSGSISAIGYEKGDTDGYNYGRPEFKTIEGVRVATLGEAESVMLSDLKLERSIYKGLDRSVLMAIYSSRKAVQAAGWSDEQSVCVNIGSSRGVTALLEQYMSEFNSTGKVPPNTSPLTTSGNISSWVAQDLNLYGPSITHSITCSTALHAIANGFAWLKSGMAKKFLAGASEAPLTPFTIAQMKAIGIYSKDLSSPFPCRPFNKERENTFMLGEGAAVFALELLSDESISNLKSSPLVIESIGFGFENIKSKSGVSKEGVNFGIAIKNTCDMAESEEPIDMIIMHAPGTVAGDYAELAAIEGHFKSSGLPLLWSSKWLTGHTLGASAGLSLQLAISILKTQRYPQFPYTTTIPAAKRARHINRIMILAAGFGGNAAAIIVGQKNISLSPTF